jgi:hypothetical protein
LQTGYFEESLEYAKRIVEIEPLSPLGYLRIGYARSAMGRREGARQAWVRSDELGGAEGQVMITLDYLSAGEFEAAISSPDHVFAAGVLAVSNPRKFIDGAVDPDTGKAFLHRWLNDAAAEAAIAGDNITAHSVYGWYVVFRYLDEAWRVIEENQAAAVTTWIESEGLKFIGIVYPATGFTSHPKFIEPILTELWDKRGPPDICSKVDGQWRCK